MTTQEIYKRAGELTEQEVENIITGWENEGDRLCLSVFKDLVGLGDSRALACATAMAVKANNKDNSKNYARAYHS